MPDTPNRPTFTLSEAASACSVGRSTIRRRLDAGAFPEAFREDGPGGPGTGPWRVPMSDLRAAGLTTNSPGAVAEQAEETPPGQAIAQLQAELAVERTRRQAAEELLAERERVVEAQAQTIRALGAPAEAAEVVPAPEPAAREEEPPTPSTESTPPSTEGRRGLLGRVRRTIARRGR